MLRFFETLHLRDVNFTISPFQIAGHQPAHVPMHQQGLKVGSWPSCYGLQPEQEVWHQPWPTYLIVQPRAGNAFCPTRLDKGEHFCHSINSPCFSPIPKGKELNRRIVILIMFFHPKTVPALEGKSGMRKSEISAAAAFAAPETEWGNKLFEGGNHALGSHCSRATPSSKLYLGSSWNKPLHSPPEHKGGTKGRVCLFFPVVSSRFLPTASIPCLGLKGVLGYGFHHTVLYFQLTFSR